MDTVRRPLSIGRENERLRRELADKVQEIRRQAEEIAQQQQQIADADTHCRWRRVGAFIEPVGRCRTWLTATPQGSPQRARSPTSEHPGSIAPKGRGMAVFWRRRPARPARASSPAAATPHTSSHAPYAQADRRHLYGKTGWVVDRAGFRPAGIRWRAALHRCGLRHGDSNHGSAPAIGPIRTRFLSPIMEPTFWAA